MDKCTYLCKFWVQMLAAPHHGFCLVTRELTLNTILASSMKFWTHWRANYNQATISWPPNHHSGLPDDHDMISGKQTANRMQQIGKQTASGWVILCSGLNEGQCWWDVIWNGLKTSPAINAKSWEAHGSNDRSGRCVWSDMISVATTEMTRSFTF